MTTQPFSYFSLNSGLVLESRKNKIQISMEGSESREISCLPSYLKWENNLAEFLVPSRHLSPGVERLHSVLRQRDPEVALWSVIGTGSHEG